MQEVIYDEYMQRGFAQPLLVLAAVVILTVGGVYFYQTSRVTQVAKSIVLRQPEFNDYKNTDLGFGFQYSKTLNVKIDSEEEFDKRGNGNFRKNFKGYVGYEPGKFLGAVAVLEKTNSFDTSPLTIWVFDNPANLTIDKWFENYWYYPYLWGVFDWSSKSHVALDTEATISGTLAKYKVVSYQPGKPKFVYLAKDQKMYLFRVIGETGEKILSTFKFLK